MKKGILILSVAMLMGCCGHAVAGEETGQRVRLSFGEHEAVVLLDNHPAGRRFVEMLPLTVTFEDFNCTEKIAYLPEKLDTRQSPASCDPEEGSFTYYAPWGNLAVFYRDFRHSSGLVPLGRVESGMEYLSAVEDGAVVRMEKME
ncbi:cyclophilin-like fold protein [Mailhella massiliensis]|uniref:cyclophilin-like fold protein n=1 Tax=Mailhella massiliensis TaxID=1903261 RepID=UPI002353C00C|nr:cyclophilin-like fold protein [Mailhella massiliensis]